MRTQCVFMGGLTLALTITPGCSSHTNTTPKTHIITDYAQGLEGLSTQAHLEMLAEREAITPSIPNRTLANQLLGGNLIELQSGTAEFTDAHRPLDEVLSEILEGIAPPTTQPSPPLPQIAKAYVKARAAMLSGDATTAISLFEQILVAAPESTDILIGLGDAYLKAGNRAQATQAYLHATKLGDRTSRALIYGAMGSSKDPDRVIKLAALIWSQNQSTTLENRAGRVLGGIMLGQALIQTGLYTAGSEVMNQAMGLLDEQTLRSTKFRRELVQLYTKRAEQYTSLGDTWLILDQPSKALKLFDRASSIVPTQPKELMARQIAAHFLQGHSSLAIMTLLDWIEANPGNDSESLLNLVGIVREHPLSGELLFDSLSQRSHDQSQLPSQRRSILGMLLSLSESPQQNLSILADADPEIVSPVACARALSRFDSRQNKLQAALSILHKSNSIGNTVTESLIRLDGHPLKILKLLKEMDDQSEASELIECSLALTIGLPDMIDTINRRPINPQELKFHSTSWLIAHARAAAIGANWDRATKLFNACTQREPTMNHAERAYFINTLIHTNRIDHALAVAEKSIAMPDPTPADWLVHAQIAQRMGFKELMLNSLSNALRLDPYNEETYEQLITAHNSNSSDGNLEDLKRITRLLGQRLPDSALIRLIRAHELAGAGDTMIQASERVLVEAHTLHPWRQIGTDLLLSLWAKQAQQGDTNASRRGLSWLDSQTAQMPGSVELVSAKARLLVLDNDSLGAEGLLDELHDRVPSRKAGRIHEGLIRSDESRIKEANTLALARLEGRKSIGDCLERLERAAQTNRLGEFEADSLIPSDPSWKYTSEQSLRIARMLGALSQTTSATSNPDHLLELLGRARTQTKGVSAQETINPLVALNQIELILRPTSTKFSMDQYESFFRSIETGIEQNEFVNIAIQSLLRARTPSDALDFFTRLSINSDNSLNEQRFVELASMLGQIGSTTDVQHSIERIENAGLLIVARDTAVSALGTLNEDTLSPKIHLNGVRADLIYSVAVVASFYERKDDAMSFYRSALELDPDHAWANNDLGYFLVESGADLHLAEQLLIKAHQAEPKAASITDSLAWARYMMGAIEDQHDGAGNTTLLGARSLLKQALTLDGGTENATIYDHLGDAQWMLGEFDSALESWLSAEARLRQRQTALSNQDNANAPALEAIRKELSTIRFKIADGESGRVPAIAKTAVGLPVPNPSDIVNSPDPTK